MDIDSGAIILILFLIGVIVWQARNLIFHGKEQKKRDSRISPEARARWQNSHHDDEDPPPMIGPITGM